MARPQDHDDDGVEGLRAQTRVLVRALPGASAFALAAVGALFVLKYGLRVTPWAVLIAPATAIIYLMAVVYLRRAGDRLSNQALRASQILIVLGALALALISPETNRVARLPALEFWLDRLFAGQFPYAAPVRPSGFPGLYALTLPFWATNTLRLLPVLGIVVFLGTIRSARLESRPAILIGLLFLAPVYYEVIVHSELFLNMALALASLHVFERARDGGRTALVGAAIFAGVVLSTRLSVGVVFLVYGAYAFRSDWIRGVSFAGAALAVWTATWLPFALWNGAQFAAEGPFTIQGLYLPNSLVVASALGALGLGWFARDLSATISRIGWLLLLLVGLSFGISMQNVGFSGILADGFDVGYFILPIPFLLYSLGRRHWFPTPGTRVVRP